MPTLTVYRTDGSQAGEIEVSDVVFAAPVNENVLHEAVVAHLANKRQGTQSALTRAEVRGGGIKPFRQKGTGRARQGSSRSPQYEGGGVVFAPKPRDYSKKVNKKARAAAVRSALSAKVAEDNLIVVEDIVFDKPRTREMVEILDNLSAPDSTLIVLNLPVPKSDEKTAEDGITLLKKGQVSKKDLSKEDRDAFEAAKEANRKIVKSASNIPGVSTTVATALSVYDILNHDKFIITKDALATLEEVFGK